MPSKDVSREVLRKPRRWLTDLDEILALGLGDERLQLGSSEGVDETSFRHDQQEDLCASEDREFVGLFARCQCSSRK